MVNAALNGLCGDFAGQGEPMNTSLADAPLSMKSKRAMEYSRRLNAQNFRGHRTGGRRLKAS